MQSIRIKYLPQTNTRGSRLKATTTGGLSYTEPTDYEFEFDNQAIKLVSKLLEKHKLNWGKPLSYGTLQDGSLVVTFDNFLLR